MVYCAVNTPLLSIPAFTAMAVMVVVAVMLIAEAYTLLLVVGVEPSMV
jgi:hypothetical protein